MPKPVILTTRISAIDVHQVAFPIGPDIDAYDLYTYFILDTVTNTLSYRAEAWKNWYNISKRVLVHSGTAQECLDAIKTIVDALGGVPTKEERYPNIYSTLSEALDAGL